MSSQITVYLCTPLIIFIVMRNIILKCGDVDTIPLCVDAMLISVSFLSAVFLIYLCIISWKLIMTPPYNVLAVAFVLTFFLIRYLMDKYKGGI